MTSRLVRAWGDWGGRGREGGEEVMRDVDQVSKWVYIAQVTELYKDQRLEEEKRKARSWLGEG